MTSTALHLHVISVVIALQKMLFHDTHCLFVTAQLQRCSTAAQSPYVTAVFL